MVYSHCTDRTNIALLTMAKKSRLRSKQKRNNLQWGWWCYCIIIWSMMIQRQILSQNKYKLRKNENVLGEKQKEKILATCSQHLTWYSFRNIALGEFLTCWWECLNESLICYTHPAHLLNYVSMSCVKSRKWAGSMNSLSLLWKCIFIWSRGYL